ncbi:MULTISPECIES: DUF3892 domain-containing protein [unclassified Bacillus (in: firmicutes)]|uniref:DUF3892 domain-containing protein n=1 Tax=unclassified Bacillus (in: firmicutes) TaxID=185979 RepID=UPI0008EA9E0A|nr:MULTISPECIES: DUF3892 domain-containing protein [unclassified Bacillus (in: firmicutes)]SFB25681.1 Protein of unknown function [Bacillus sp. UNCCL13]SFQ91798.1 Protein of unknown function [Bacillus sp. cl95]
MEQLVALDRNQFGDIISFQTSSGRIISYRKAIEEIESGVITGVSIAEEEGATLLSPTENLSFEQFPYIY